MLSPGTGSAGQTPGESLRSLLQHGGLLLPGVFNAITARAAERAGYSALYLSGAGVTNSLTAFPDIALITLSEMAAQARYVCRAASCPVLADADTGYGDALNVARAVEELEHAGLAGIHLEDQVAPKRCGHLDGKQVIEPVEMARKIRAAVKARANPAFVIVARTDTRSVNGLQDAIDRGRRCQDAGADALFPESLQSEEEFAAFAEAVHVPVIANMTEFGKTPLIPAARFFQLGCSAVLFPMTAFRVMMKAATALYTDLKATGTQAAWIGSMQTRAELYEMIGYADFESFDREIAEEIP
ncbi:MAG: methylisocitrate lyase [Armatimonadetes bacterium]|nr:methylisocitrate lyase [Armatimonadota bacterium]MDE2205514.1 methylisocitrate lyase [Armatimonadota bacterium]